jgi:hypothetical protein
MRYIVLAAVVLAGCQWYDRQQRIEHCMEHCAITHCIQPCAQVPMNDVQARRLLCMQQCENTE